jgi:hypothetical protein
VADELKAAGGRTSPCDGELLAVCKRCGWPTVVEAQSLLPKRCWNPKCGAELSEQMFLPLEKLRTLKIDLDE